MARWEYCRISWAEHVRAPDAQAGAAGNTSGGESMVPNMGQQGGPTGWVEYVGRGAAADASGLTAPPAEVPPPA